MEEKKIINKELFKGSLIPEPAAKPQRDFSAKNSGFIWSSRGKKPTPTHVPVLPPCNKLIYSPDTASTQDFLPFIFFAPHAARGDLINLSLLGHFLLPAPLKGGSWEEASPHGVTAAPQAPSRLHSASLPPTFFFFLPLFLVFELVQKDLGCCPSGGTRK